MKKFTLVLISIICTIILIICWGCSTVKPYSLTGIKPEIDSVLVLMPPSETMQAYNSALAKQWERTYNYCSQTKVALVKEIDEREKNLTLKRSWLLAIGGIAGIANTVYAGLKDKPQKEVVIPLSLIAGSALITLLPSFVADERLEFLKDKLTRIKTLQGKCVQNFNEIESMYLKKGYIDMKCDPQNSSTFNLSPVQVDSLRNESEKLAADIETSSSKLREGLTEWSNEAQ